MIDLGLKSVISYIDNIDKKEKLMLISSIVIVGIIFYMYVNYPLFKKIEHNRDKINNLNTILSPKYIEDLNNLQKKKLQLLKKLSLKKEDLRYLKMYILSEQLLYIDDFQFFNILKLLLGSKSNMFPSYDISVDTKGELKKYIVTISGSNIGFNLRNFYNMMKKIETIRYVKSIDEVGLTPTSNGFNFKVKLSFWSFK